MRVIETVNRVDRMERWVFMVLLSIFIFRVFAQIIQHFFDSSYLPPFDAWDSGILPYWLLVTIQMFLISILTRITINIAKRRVVPSPKRGKIYLVAGTAYFIVMLIRLIGGFTFASHSTWFNAWLPTIVHLDLALWLVLLGKYHYQEKIVGRFA